MFWKTKPLLLSLVLVGSSIFLQARTAAADESDMDRDPCLTDSICRAHFQRGRKLSKEDNYAEALVAYEAAQLRRQVPWLLINIGRTLHKLGRPAEAASYYKRYFADEPSGPPERKQRALQFQAEAEEEVAKLGAIQKQNPQPAPGTTTGASPPPSTTPAAAAIVEPPPAPLSPTPTPSPTPKVETTGRPTWLWTGVAVGGGVLLVGGAVGIAALVQRSHASSAVYVGDPSAEALAAKDNARSLGIAADVLIGVGAVTAGATAIAYLVKTRRKEQPKTAVLPALQAGARSVLVGAAGAF
ncbi:MAG TPA: tetratricopeptide repeat protein [Pseudomonadota bacterium]|nr:tetratricopeptide repeat protein [Pseudomonadota bacterium]